MLEVLPALAALLSMVLAVPMFAVFSVIRQNRTPRLLLVLLLGFGSIFQIIVFLKISGKIPAQSFWYEAQVPFYLGCFPLIYLCVRSFTERGFKLSEISQWHLAPFLLGWAFCVLEYALQLSPLSTEFLIVKYARAYITTFIALPFLWLSQRKIRIQRQEAKETDSSLINLRFPWLRFLLGLWYLSVFAVVLDIVTGLRVPMWFFASLAIAVQLLGLVYYGLCHSQLFVQEFKAPYSALLSREELEQRVAQLISFLQKEKFYLRPQIRLSDLAEALGVKSYLLSEVINRGLGTNFYDLINGLRIERAKSMLRDPAFSHMNILGISAECGFNSKSSFNESFRRIVGVTPSRFRDLFPPKFDSSESGALAIRQMPAGSDLGTPDASLKV